MLFLDLHPTFKVCFKAFIDGCLGTPQWDRSSLCARTHFAHSIFATQLHAVSVEWSSQTLWARGTVSCWVSQYWVCHEQQKIQQIGVDTSHVIWLLACAISLARSRASCSAEPDMVMWSTRPAFSYSTFKFFVSLMFLFYHRKVSAPPSLVHPFLSAIHVTKHDTAQQHEMFPIQIHNIALFCACISDVYHWQRCIVCVHIEHACIDLCFGVEALPMSSASSGPTKRPVKIISLDLLLPIKRGSRWVPPALHMHQAHTFHCFYCMLLFGRERYSWDEATVTTSKKCEVRCIPWSWS